MDDIDIEQLRFRRGFMAARDHQLVDATVPEHWTRRVFAGHRIAHCPTLAYSASERHDRGVAILGLAMDVTDPHLDTDRLTDALVDTPDLQNAIDRLGGHFVIFIRRGTTVYLQGDATGTRSILHTLSSPIVATSHERLAADALSLTASSLGRPWMARNKTPHLPGRMSPFHGLVYLIPNVQLDLGTGDVERIFPRQPLESRSAVDVTETILPMLTGQVAALRGRRFLFSLSAGIDSRTSLALMKPVLADTTLFTYENPTAVGSDVDVAVAKTITDELRLDLRTFFIPDLEAPDAFVEVLKENCYRPHSHNLAWHYYSAFPADALHIRSNLLEIGRTFWRKKPGKRTPLDAEGMTELYAPRGEDLDLIRDAFTEYIATCSFSPPPGYDPFDLFYWEHRMGTWHSTIVTESDIAHDTMVLFNSRAILGPLLSVPFHDRHQATVYHEIIRSQWPVLSHWLINQTTVTPEKGSVGLNLRDAVISGPDADPLGGDGARAVWHDDQHLTIWLDRSDPAKGDRAAATVTIPVDTPVQIQLEVHSPYDNPNGKGRLHYSVSTNGAVAITEDIADWSIPNLVTIRTSPVGGQVVLEVAVEADRDCRPSHWGRAGRIHIGPVHVRDIPPGTPLGVWASSPFSRISHAVADPSGPQQEVAAL